MQNNLNPFTVIFSVGNELRCYEVFASDAKSAKEMCVLNDRYDYSDKSFKKGMPFEVMRGVNLLVWNDIMEDLDGLVDAPVVFDTVGGKLEEVE
jgi:hypothetical protein